MKLNSNKHITKDGTIKNNPNARNALIKSIKKDFAKQLDEMATSLVSAGVDADIKVSGDKDLYTALMDLSNDLED